MNKRKRGRNQMPLKESLLRHKTLLCETSQKNKAAYDIESKTELSHNDKSHAETNTSVSQSELTEFDDSFDLFLPKKNTQKVSSSQNSFFDAKKKSRYFNDAGKLQLPKVVKDDDLELALAISLEESQGGEVSLPSCTEAVPIKGRTKKKYGQSLLMKQTSTERERIVTEKVAIVLMDNNKITVSSLADTDRRYHPQSSSLKKHYDEERTLWSLSQSDLSQVTLQKLLVKIMLRYESLSCPEEKLLSQSLESNACVPVQEKSEELLRTVSCEDIFGDCSVENGEPQRSKRIRLSETFPERGSFCQIQKSREMSTNPIHLPTVSQSSCSKTENSVTDLLLNSRPSLVNDAVCDSPLSNSSPEGEANFTLNTSTRVGKYPREVNVAAQILETNTPFGNHPDSTSSFLHSIDQKNHSPNNENEFDGPNNQRDIVDLTNSPRSTVSLCSRSTDEAEADPMDTLRRESFDEANKTVIALEDDANLVNSSHSTISAANRSTDEIDDFGIVHNSTQNMNEELELRVESNDIVNFGSSGVLTSSSLSTEDSTVHENLSKVGVMHDNFVVPKTEVDLMEHYQKLSSDLVSLCVTTDSRVIEVKFGNNLYYAHAPIFNARCPLLLMELEKNVNCLSDYSPNVCSALFKYIYAADIHECLQLDSAEREQLTRISRKFGLLLLCQDLSAGGGMVNGNADKSITFGGKPPSPESRLVKGDERRSKNRTAKDFGSDSDEVIVLDSNSGSPVGTSRPETPDYYSAIPDDRDLDLYRREGVCLSDQHLLGSNIGTENRKDYVAPIAKNVTNTERPKNSIERYFEDSFPLVETPSASPSSNQTRPEPTPGPSGSYKIVDCVTPGGQLVVSEDATPCPQYESLKSPELQNELEKYGIKKVIGRKKAVTLLKYIYDQIHPEANHPAVTKAINDVKKSLAKPANPDSDGDVYSLSSDCSEDQELFEELGDVATPEKSTEDNNTPAGLLQRVGGFIKSNKVLYTAILKYEPIWLNKFFLTLKEEGIKCSKKELVVVLDELGITFRTEKPEKQQRQRRRMKPKKKKS